MKEAMKDLLRLSAVALMYNVFVFRLFVSKLSRSLQLIIGCRSKKVGAAGRFAVQLYLAAVRFTNLGQMCRVRRLMH